MSTAAHAPPGRRGRLLVLAICTFSLFMIYLDSTILNVALPTLQRHFDAGLSGLQWVVDAYMVVLASLLLLSGATADRIGRRKVFTIGLLTFAAGSLLCSIAPSIGFLIGFRALQAIGGSMLTPVSLSIVRNTFTDSTERAQALGLWSAVFGLATACGPIVGGVLVDFVGWRSVFFVNVPIGILAFVLARRYIPESSAEHPRKLDPLGQALVIVFLATLTYSIIEGPSLGWSAPVIAVGFGVSVAALFAFLLVERRRDEPLIDLRFFKSPPFAGSNAIATLAFVVLGGFLFVNTLYLQEVRGYSALEAGLAMLPVTGFIVLSSPVAGRLVARRGPRLPLVAAGVFLLLGSLLLLVVGPSTPYLELACAYVVLGIGLGLVNPPVTNTAVTSMPPSQAGVASAITSSTRQLGSVLGVAVGGALLTSQFHAGLASRIAPLHLARPLRVALDHLSVASGTALPERLMSHNTLLALIDDAFAAATHGPWLLFAGCGLGCTVVALLTTGRRARRLADAVYRDVGGALEPTLQDEENPISRRMS